jgi:hypothetical protein
MGTLQQSIKCKHDDRDRGVEHRGSRSAVDSACQECSSEELGAASLAAKDH